MKRNFPGVISLLFLISLSQTTVSQSIDNTASFRMIDGSRYVRIFADNDYFTATDDYYTQGINIEMVHPAIGKFPLTRLLVVSKAAKKRYGFAIEHNGYTPTSIEHDDILYGDRPFAGSIMLKTFAMSVDSVRHRRITSSLSLGIIGPPAAGFGIQKTIHEWIHYTIPHGWNNQISNDVIVNYELGAERNILRNRNRFLLNTSVNARIGTLNTKLSGGFVIMLGKLNPVITRAFTDDRINAIETRKLRFHVYLQPLVNVVGYDATLQGGLFNHNSPYTIPANEIQRVTVQANYGFVLTFRSMYLEYFKAYIGKEFKTGDHHRWGGIRVGVKW